ncbi:MAG: dockerin type I repeat-containing protein [Ruminococcus sp.]|nr:dockerin type I repeat-containing protein [Ruminococcus sp.]
MKKQHRRGKRLRRALCTLTATMLSMMIFPVQASAEEYWDGDKSVLKIETVAGDVNSDGIFNISDAVIVQKWLLSADTTNLRDWEAADFCRDNKLDMYDFCIMKRELLDQKEVPVTDGKLYQRIRLTDPQIGVVAYEGILPEGWSVQIASNWGNVNPMPGQEFVVFTSPDGKAAIQIASPQYYKQASNRGEGVDISNYTTYVNYMNASDYIDYFVQNNYSNAEKVKEIEIPEEQQNEVNEIARSGLDTFINSMNSMTAYYGYTMYPQGYEGTVCRRQFKTGDSYAEYCCAIYGYEYYYTVVYLNVSELWWKTLNTVSYQAVDKEAFDEYYNDYEMITANGYFTAAFYSANDYVANKIAAMIIDARTVANAESAASSYSSSGTEITSDDMSTQDRVFQAWDDYIKDEDRYATTDGYQVTTSMFNETVAQDGDKFYVGRRTGIPDGYTELSKVEP